MTVLKRTLLAWLALATSAWAAQAQEATIKIGLVKSISSVANLWAMQQGYFREVGIKLVPEDLDTSANVLALLAQGQLQIIEGGISAGYFNAIEKNLPEGEKFAFLPKPFTLKQLVAAVKETMAS